MPHSLIKKKKMQLLQECETFHINQEDKFQVHASEKMLFSTKYLHFFIAALLLTKFLLSTFPLYFCFLCFVINLCVVLGVSACCCVLFYFPCLSACVIALIVPTCVLSAPFCFPAVSSPRCALRP